MASDPTGRKSSMEPFSNTMSSTPSPSHETDPSAPFPDFDFAYEEPLYTEINIPLPRLPSPPRDSSQTSTRTAQPSPPPPSSSSPPAQSKQHSRHRARSLSSFSPFRSRSSTPPTSTSEPWPRIRPAHVRNREVAAAMDLSHQSKRNRSSTIDALAVVPAVLVLSAELFTPGSGEGGRGGGKGDGNGGRKDSGVGRWENAVR